MSSRVASYDESKKKTQGMKDWENTESWSRGETWFSFQEYDHVSTWKQQKE
jgi:hypothetical protein